MLAVVLALLVVVLGYVAYVFIDYHRIGNQELTVERNAAATVEAGKEYGILSYNIGFGAYEDDYSFFMDGGTESRAWSEERLTANIERIGAFLQQQDADLYLLQEVDRDSTRSYHVDEVAMLTAQLPGLGYIWAQNYDSPYLFYPLDQPHGKSVSGLLTPLLLRHHRGPAGGAAHRGRCDEAGGSGSVLQRPPHPRRRRPGAGAV